MNLFGLVIAFFMFLSLVKFMNGLVMQLKKKNIFIVFMSFYYN